MNIPRQLVICLAAATALSMAMPDTARTEPAPFPTTIGIRDVNQPPSAGRDPVPFVPKSKKPSRPGSRKPAKPPRTAVGKTAPPAPPQAKPQVQAAPAPAAHTPQVQAAPAATLPTPEELNRKYSAVNESLSPLAVGPIPAPASASAQGAPPGPASSSGQTLPASAPGPNMAEPAATPPLP